MLYCTCRVVEYPGFFVHEWNVSVNTMSSFTYVSVGSDWQLYSKG
jgi:hypothetical protein